VATELHPLDEHFLTEAAELQPGEPRGADEPVQAGSTLTVRRARELFECQCESRQQTAGKKRRDRYTSNRSNRDEHDAWWNRFGLRAGRR